MSLKSAGYQVIPETARISCSIHQDRPNKAKKMFIEKILPYELPSPADITDMREDRRLTIRHAQFDPATPEARLKSIPQPVLAGLS